MCSVSSVSQIGETRAATPTRAPHIAWHAGPITPAVPLELNANVSSVIAITRHTPFMFGLFTSESIRPLLVLRCYAAETPSPSNLPPAVLDHLRGPVGPPTSGTASHGISPLFLRNKFAPHCLTLPSRLPVLKVHLVWTVSTAV